MSSNVINKVDYVKCAGFLSAFAEEKDYYKNHCLEFGIARKIVCKILKI